MASEFDDPYVPVISVEEATEESPQTLRVDGRTIGLFHHDGEFYATDNRCPHMGFPLTDGSVDDGILTCPWHHARFEISCGDTFDPFADDVGTYPVEVRDGDVYVDPHPPREEPPEERWRNRLEHGLQENLGLIVAKSVIGLDDAGVASSVPVRIGVQFGTRYREDGWGRGLTTLGVMANLLGDLRPEDRRRALYVGLSEVADDCAGEPPFFVQERLSTDDVTPERLKRWFQSNIEVRDSDGAERVLRAAIAADLEEPAIAELLVAAATDHLYLDNGHRLDFINKAFETLDHVGWEHADEVLPSLAPGLAAADRAEENSSWRQPIDVAQLCFDAAAELPHAVEQGSNRTWEKPDEFVDVVMGEDPREIIDQLMGAIANGATAEELANVVTHAAGRRIAQFGTSNEFRDWNTVHHTYTYANAVFCLSRRTDASEAYRGVFDAAVNVYLDRFLNTPPTPLPDPDGDRDPDEVSEELLECFEVESDEEVDRAGQLTAEFLAADGDVDRLKRALGEVLLREDVGFHPRQNLEAAFTQYDAAVDERNGRVHLIATARYLSAHTPTRRAGEQTYRIADRLNRGEKIHEA
ncbi:Rieske 2Fe-2S domain-containing protein [Halalkaliarchaeum sp. AArc-GB]|uniref:Rieske (2Fe-2S) protein n=1 Tax=unclassified Halalkaliarchaeum TaxID=2678344 RepID=UPI00217D7F49|nr:MULTISPECIES: Rieske 2Fe-2S domain-containing protein [unclassified Halalkaliarchaeum]MDR5672554.1 Rieske 2Fe-2S domain-containing protein [Halalkaliarchaeum sp. AArc-GB]